jgi:hypothetical protein
MKFPKLKYDDPNKTMSNEAYNFCHKSVPSNGADTIPDENVLKKDGFCLLNFFTFIAYLSLLIFHWILRGFKEVFSGQKMDLKVFDSSLIQLSVTHRLLNEGEG